MSAISPGRALPRQRRLAANNGGERGMSAIARRSRPLRGAGRRSRAALGNAHAFPQLRVLRVRIPPMAGTRLNPHLPRCCKQWRREGDSNPRDPHGPNGFQDRRIQPLCHLSVRCHDSIPAAPRRSRSILPQPPSGSPAPSPCRRPRRCRSPWQPSAPHPACGRTSRRPRARAARRARRP